MDLFDLFRLRFPFFGVSSFHHHLVAISSGALPAMVRDWDWISISLFVCAFLSSLIQFRLVIPFFLLALIWQDWRKMDLMGWTLILLFFATQVFRFFMAARW